MNAKTLAVLLAVSSTAALAGECEDKAAALRARRAEVEAARSDLRAATAEALVDDDPNHAAVARAKDKLDRASKRRDDAERARDAACSADCPPGGPFGDKSCSGTNRPG